ncbi:hypothetical protein AUP07_0499 [methanogenic archaeon mixed culture ISO4-G1]|nr:hypothetical protein AUP07_0499 [methanogenic archaeon mixed culture ISO4-G1]
MDTRKMTLFATIAAIALLAVGIGYAYMASTSNTGNTVNSEYLLISQNGNDLAPKYSNTFNKSVEFNTETTFVDTTEPADGVPDTEKAQYTLTGNNVETYTTKFVNLGTVYLTVDQHNSSQNYNVIVTVEGKTGLDTTTYNYYAQFNVGTSSTESDAKAAADAVVPTPADGDLVAFNVAGNDAVAQTATPINAGADYYSVVKLTIFAALSGGDPFVKDLDTPFNAKALNDVTFKFTAQTTA